MKVFSAVIASAAAAGAGTDYSVQGDNWEGDCATGFSQSPIDINSDAAWRMADHNPFETHGYYNKEDWSVAYDGGLTFSPFTDEIHMWGGNLDTNTGFEEGKWRLAQFHLHWGGMTEDGLHMGSEHTFNKEQYYSEVHFVHYNTKYADLGEAATKADGLAVLGYFIDHHEDDHESTLDTLLQSAMMQVNEATEAAAVAAAEAAADAPPVPVARREAAEGVVVREAAADIVNHQFEHYYRYQGSLTTPGCYETVQWTVFDHPLMINQATVDMMASMSDDKSFENNWRNTQPMNGRHVEFYMPYEEVDMSSGVTASLSAITLAFVYGQL